MLENVDVAASLSPYVEKEGDDAGRTSAYTLSKKKVSKISSITSMMGGGLPHRGLAVCDCTSSSAWPCRQYGLSMKTLNFAESQ